MKKDFTNNLSCIDHVHCATCRNLEGGRKWRESLTKAFKLPEGKVDFDCPHGVPWNPTEDQLPEPARLPVRKKTLTDRVIELCQKCSLDGCSLKNKALHHPCTVRRIIEGNGQTWHVARQQCKKLSDFVDELGSRNVETGKETGS